MLARTDVQTFDRTFTVYYNNPQEPAAAVRLQHLLRVSTKIILRRVFEEYQAPVLYNHVDILNVLNILNISNILIRLS